MTSSSPFLRILPLLLLGPLSYLILDGSSAPALDLHAPDRVTQVTIDDRAWLRVDCRANEYTSSTQDEPSLFLAKDGSATVVWQSRRQQNASDGVYARRFAASGEIVGGEAALNLWQWTDQIEPAVVSSADMRWAAWQSLGQDGDGSGVYLRRLDRNNEARISQSPAGDQYGVVLAAGRHGGVVAAWLSSDVDQTVARLRLFDRAGRSVGKELDLGAASGVSVASRAEGAIVVWQHPVRGLLAQCIDWSGTCVTAPHLVVPAGATTIEPAVCASADGYALVWMELPDGAHKYDVHSRRLGRDAAPLGQSLLVSEDASWNSGASVASFDDGRLAFVWNAEAAGSDESHVMLRMLSVDDHLGTSYQIGTGRVRVADGRPGIVTGGRGRLALAWYGDARLGDRSGVHLTLLVPDRGAGLATVAKAREPAQNTTTEPGSVVLARFKAEKPIATYTTELAAQPQGQHELPYYEKPDPRLANWGKGPRIQAASGDFGFPGFSTGFRKLTPPDPHIACGPAHVIGVVNVAIAFWKKDGTRTFLANFTGTGGFWTGVGATGFVFDAEVQWDPHANRFVAMANERSGSKSLFLIAISDDSDPNGTWHKYRIDVTTAAGSGIDSPNLGIDDKALYLTADMYNSNRKYFIYIMEKKPLLSGKAPGIARSTSMTRFSAGIPVMWGTAPAMYMIQEATSTTLKLFAIGNPLTSPTIVSTTITVPFYSRPTPLTQKGTTRRITTFNARFWSCVWRNGSLWACHHQGSPVKARWYEIKTNTWPTSGKPTLVQSGDVNAGTGRHASFNSIAVDESGNALMTFASSSVNDYLSIARAWRASTDKKGTMRPAVIIKSNTSAYLGSRWGDYSAAVADPGAVNTIWYTHELAPTSSWTTWISGKKTSVFGSDVASISASTGGTVNFVLDNPSQAGKPYLIIGTLSGTSPGFKLGSLQVPINLDLFTTLALSLATSPAFPGFFGTLDLDGNATAAMHLPPLPGLIGKTMHFAFIQDFTSWTYASPATAVAIIK